MTFTRSHAAATATLIGVAIVVALSGCGSTSSSSSTTAAAATAPTASTATSARATQSSAAASALAPYLTAPSKLVVTQPLKRRPPAEKAVFLSNGIEIAQQISAGMKAASAALGWQYSTLSVDQNNPATVASDTLTAVNNGANVVFVSATPVAVFKSALAVAKQHGVAVIDVASGNPPTPGITALVNNASRNGPLWGKQLALGALADAAQHKKTAKIVLVTSPIFATILGATDAAAKATVAKQCPSCSFDTLDIPPNDLFAGKAPASVVSYLQSHQDVNYILQDSSLTDPGLVPALKAAGLTGVGIFGVAPLKPQVGEVASGQEAGWVIDPLQVEGWMAVDAAARKFSGGDPAVYNTQAIPSYLLTKANATDPTEVPSDYTQQFKSMWHAG